MMRSCVCGALVALAHGLAFAPVRASEADADRFTISLARSDISGTGANAVNVFDKRISDIDEGTRNSIGLGFDLGGGWSIDGAYERAYLNYQSPLGGLCQPVAGILLGYEFCRPQSTARVGSIEDELDSLAISVAKRWQLSRRFSVLGALGYRRTEWSSPDDVEAATYSSCKTFYGLDLNLPDCDPIAREVHASGWTARVASIVELGAGFEVELSARWEAERYQIFRNQAAPRFCQTNSQSEFGGACDDLEGFLPSSAFDGDDWYWWSSTLTWTTREAPWSFVLRAEAGGTRDWRVLTGEVRYHW